MFQQINDFYRVPRFNYTEIIEFWDRLGFLDNLDNRKRIEVSIAFDVAIKYVMANGWNEEMFANLYLLPVVRRVVEANVVVDVKHLVNSFRDYVNSGLGYRIETFNVYGGGNEGDPEAAAIAEFCALYKPSMFNKLRNMSL
jgi:hypothetical protein